jgi:hypothetical protein
MLPTRTSGTLESLEVNFRRGIDGYDALSASAFINLLEFVSNQISPESLTALLTHCRSLEKLSYVRWIGERQDAEPADSHLKVLSKRLPPNLKFLKIHYGAFSSKVLADFVKSCHTLQCLDLEYCYGLTPSILRAIFQWPLLRELSLEGMHIARQHEEELDRISKMETPPKLKLRYHSWKN